MGFAVIDGELVHTSRLGDDMQNFKWSFAKRYSPKWFADWAVGAIRDHEGIAHVHITITLSDGTKKDYMQGAEGWGGIEEVDWGPDVAEEIPDEIALPGGPFKIRRCNVEPLGDAGSAGMTWVGSDGSVATVPANWFDILGDPRKGVSLNLSQDHTGEYIDGEPKR